MIIILGGICSVTKIVYMPYRAAVMRNATVEETLQRFSEECDTLLTTAAAYLPTPVLLSPLVGIDLTRYAGHQNELLFEMQTLMDSCIPRINTYIQKANGDRGLITPNISSCIHRCRGRNKGYRTHYMKLTDGCHLTEEVKLVWAKALIGCVHANLLLKEAKD